MVFLCRTVVHARQTYSQPLPGCVLDHVLNKEFDAHPAVGQELSVFFRNAGAPASILAVDAVTVTFQH